MSGKILRTKSILVFLRLAFGSGRDIMYGISQYARQHCHWRFHIMNFTGAETLREISRAEANGIDGIIGNGFENRCIASYMRTSNTPLVCIGACAPELRCRRKSIAFVTTDDDAIGRAGAEHLTSMGRFRTYGFITLSEGAQRYVLSDRERGFRDWFAAKGIEVNTYRTASGIERGSSMDIAAISEWLKSLKKPAAVMATHDLRAAQVIEAASLASVRVPQDVSVIGVDNDTLYCESSNPSITSISPDHVKIGELAAKALKRLMGKSQAHMPISICYAATTTVERQSTKPVPPATLLVERALAFIHQNATKGIKAADVTGYLGVSRRLADLRFRQIAGVSILEAIQARRFDEVRRQLTESSLPITKVIANCGFKTESNAKTLFRKRYGISMSDYRREVTV